MSSARLGGDQRRPDAGGWHTEFGAARAFLERLDAPKLAVPGDHDITPYNLLERFADSYARWRTMIGTETEPSWSDGVVAVLGLNTARRFGLNWDWSRGRVTRARLLRLIARLDAVPGGVVRVVVAHHPLLPPETEPETPVAGGAAAALAALTHHHVVLVLAGHLHRGYAGWRAQGARCRWCCRVAPRRRCACAVGRTPTIGLRWLRVAM